MAATEQYTLGGGEMVIQAILTGELCLGMLCYSGGASKGKPVIHMGPVGVNGYVEAHNGMENYKETFRVYGQCFALKAAELVARKTTDCDNLWSAATHRRSTDSDTMTNGGC